MHLIAVDEGVFEEGGDSVYVVFCHFADVLEEEGERFENAVLDVKFGDTVFVHQGGEYGKGSAGFRDDADGDGSADAGLALLDSEVIEKGGENVLRADSFGNEAEGIVGCSPDTPEMMLACVEI